MDIDALMDRASRALEATSYFEAWSLSRAAIGMAFDGSAFERAARICLPMQEASRQIRQIAMDVGVERGVVVRGSGRVGVEAGCVLFEPPAIGIDATRYRLRAMKDGVSVSVLCREPVPGRGPHAGKIPLVAVGEISVRAYVEPPVGSEPDPKHPARLRLADPLPVAWYEAAGEALGDAAIASVRQDQPAAWRAADLLDRVDAFPEHEKLYQALAGACRDATCEPTPTERRRSPTVDDPFSF